jgi:hypothetical protein
MVGKSLRGLWPRVAASFILALNSGSLIFPELIAGFYAIPVARRAGEDGFRYPSHSPRSAAVD